ncbi:hypothetical protein [Spirosoma sp. KNUC1025]|uniref:hypothetical protein n=1 Tax=Spirosoma sp. KNUC1025 TaxID=2894082 RepID=UPI00386B8A04|nr:hypothetical protein LN737_23715 [Spirosoma sp. KNUC1025]
MLAYIFLFITGIFYVGLALLTASKPTLVGDRAMGYGLALFALGVGFALSSLILAIVGISKGGFNWVSQEMGVRTAVVLLSWLLMALATFFCAVFKWEWHVDTTYPQFLHALAVRHGQVWIPLLWLGTCFFSIDSGGQSSVSPYVYKIPFWLGLGISALFSGGLLVGYMRDSIKSAEAEMASQKEQEDRFHRESLEEIAAHKPTDPIFHLLSYSSRYRPEDVRQAALAKIKAHPDWETKLLELLNDKRAYQEVYYFLDGNPVDHPEQFVEPLNRSLLWLAETIRTDIKDSNNLQHWSFDMYGIERLLMAIDGQFLNQGVDFYPNVIKLQQALNTPPPNASKMFTLP